MIFSEAPLIKTGPTVKRGRSKQDYETPNDFMAAVIEKFGKPAWDLAASAENTKAPNFITEEQNSLLECWPDNGDLCWLNPPFGDIAPWAAKCEEAANHGAKILFLTPASIGSNWFASYVHQKAMVFALNPRLCFDGKNPYPKDCILSCFNCFIVNGFDVWKWKAITKDPMTL